jgi:hypothetical protein
MPLEPLKLFGTTFSSWVKRVYYTHWRGRGCEVAWRERRDESGSGGVSTHGVLRRSCGGAWASQPRVLVSNRNERTCRNLTSESDTGRNPSAHGLQVQGSHFDALAAVGQGTNDQSETLNGVSASLLHKSEIKFGSSWTTWRNFWITQADSTMDQARIPTVLYRRLHKIQLR